MGHVFFSADNNFFPLGTIYQVHRKPSRKTHSNFLSDEQIIGVALHRAGVEHRTNFDAMVKGHQAAVLEFTHWLKNMSSKPFFSDRIRCYDPGRRRVFCKQSIRGQTTRNISRGRCRSKSGSRSRRRRMTTTTTTSSTGALALWTL